MTFIEMMHDDFNTPKALSVMIDLARTINTKVANGEDASLDGQVLKHLGHMIGILGQDPEAFFKGGEDLDGEVAALIQAREKAKADEIRDQLTNMGIVLEDSANGTIWRRG